MYRQGDVSLKAAPVPPAAKMVAEKRIVLALGEVTGHSHVIEGAVEEWVVEEAGRAVARYVKVLEAASLVHEEHSTHTVAPGTYEVTIQVEEDDEGVRNVAD